MDARIFEIVSFAILKTHYGDMSIYWGWELDEIEEEKLVLFKISVTLSQVILPLFSTVFYKMWFNSNLSRFSLAVGIGKTESNLKMNK